MGEDLNIIDELAPSDPDYPNALDQMQMEIICKRKEIEMISEAQKATAYELGPQINSQPVSSPDLNNIIEKTSSAKKDDGQMHTIEMK